MLAVSEAFFRSLLELLVEALLVPGLLAEVLLVARLLVEALPGLLVEVLLVLGLLVSGLLVVALPVVGLLLVASVDSAPIFDPVSAFDLASTLSSGLASDSLLASFSDLDGDLD
jgi:uncharacterized membrane protein